MLLPLPSPVLLPLATLPQPKPMPSENRGGRKARGGAMCTSCSPCAWPSSVALLLCSDSSQVPSPSPSHPTSTQCLSRSTTALAAASACAWLASRGSSGASKQTAASPAVVRWREATRRRHRCSTVATCSARPNTTSRDSCSWCRLHSSSSTHSWVERLTMCASLQLAILSAWHMRPLMSLLMSAREHCWCLPRHTHANTSAALRLTCPGVLGPTSCSKHIFTAWLTCAVASTH
mmetsp:Transcript_18299/g.51321  ORF Transcript_18299/g.51321 Transcript_18299/m.51321 type:complete len:234 (-) Transcript_18299:293-994(-)